MTRFLDYLASIVVFGSFMAIAGFLAVIMDDYPFESAVGVLIIVGMALVSWSFHRVLGRMT